MYTLKFTRAAFHDLTWRAFSGAELDAIEGELKRIAQLNDVRLDDAVMTVAQTEHEWMRLKITKPRQIRVFFTLDEKRHYLIVRLVIARGSRTYDVAEIMWKATKKAA
jgi:hypothetical protein